VTVPHVEIPTEVKYMLLADKLQNYKDFKRYHKGEHLRTEELDSYFNKWLDYLDVELQWKTKHPSLLNYHGS